LIAFDQNQFAESIYFVLNNSNNFIKIKQNQRQILVEYILMVQNQDNKLKNILNGLIYLSRGINEPDFVVHCELEMAMMRKKLNIQ